MKTSFSNPTGFPRDFWDRIHRVHPLSARVGLLFAVLALPALLATFLDPRIVNGEPVWLKPFKFLFSSALYAWFFAWVLSFIKTKDRPGPARWIGRLGQITIIALAIEIVVIVGQAALGNTSHFNVSTPLNAILFSIMGMTIGVLWVAGCAAMIMLLRQRVVDPAFDLSLRMGLGIAVIGMLAAFQMTGPTGAQLEAVRATGKMAVSGAHTVGAPDGGAGIPLTHWNRDHGDLRVPHFLSLHAMQVLPLFGWWLTRRRRLRAEQRTALAWTASLAYFAFFLILWIQANLGQALLRPGVEILTAAGVSALAAALAVVIVLLRPGKNAGATGDAEVVS